MEQSVSARWLKRYRAFFLILLLIVAIQLFLAYKSLDIVGGGSGSGFDAAEAPASPPPPHAQARVQPPARTKLTAQQLGFQPECDILAREAISALQRAKTKDCREHIAQIACAIKPDASMRRSSGAAVQLVITRPTFLWDASRMRKIAAFWPATTAAPRPPILRPNAWSYVCKAVTRTQGCSTVASASAVTTRLLKRRSCRTPVATPSAWATPRKSAADSMP